MHEAVFFYHVGYAIMFSFVLVHVRRCLQYAEGVFLLYLFEGVLSGLLSHKTPCQTPTLVNCKGYIPILFKKIYPLLTLDVLAQHLHFVHYMLWFRTRDYVAVDSGISMRRAA